MRNLITSPILIGLLLLNGVTALAGSKHPKQQKSRVQTKARKSSRSTEQAREKRESRKEAATRRELAKRNPRFAALLKEDSDLDAERFDQPREAMEWYLQKRLPKGEKVLPVERYFQAKEKIKRMKRFSTAKNKNLPPPAEAIDEVLDIGDGEFPG